MYLRETRGQVSQGDIFDGLPLAHINDLLEPPTVRSVKAVLITYDCEYDKPNCTHVLIAEVLPLKGVHPNSQGNVRKNKVASAFYLEPHDPLEESYVDFRKIGFLPKSVVEKCASAGQRLLSVNDDVQFALREQLANFFGYDR